MKKLTKIILLLIFFIILLYFGIVLVFYLNADIKEPVYYTICYTYPYEPINLTNISIIG